MVDNTPLNFRKPEDLELAVNRLDHLLRTNVIRLEGPGAVNEARGIAVDQRRLYDDIRKCIVHIARGPRQHEVAGAFSAFFNHMPDHFAAEPGGESERSSQSIVSSPYPILRQHEVTEFIDSFGNQRSIAVSQEDSVRFAMLFLAFILERSDPPDRRVFNLSLYPAVEYELDWAVALVSARRLVPQLPREAIEQLSDLLGVL